MRTCSSVSCSASLLVHTLCVKRLGSLGYTLILATLMTSTSVRILRRHICVGCIHASGSRDRCRHRSCGSARKRTRLLIVAIFHLVGGVTSCLGVVLVRRHAIIVEKLLIFRAVTRPHKLVHGRAYRLVVIIESFRSLRLHRVVLDDI